MGSGAITISALLAASAWMVAPLAVNPGALAFVVVVVDTAATGGAVPTPAVAPKALPALKEGSVVKGAETVVVSLPPEKSARSVCATRTASALRR